MNAGLSLSLQLLRLSTRRRLGLVVGALIVSLSLYGLAFPTTTLGAILLPLVLSAWLFGWRGGLCCFVGLTVVLGVSYGLAFSWIFWSPAWFFPWVANSLSGLTICLVVGLVRRLTDALLDAQRTVASTEESYQQERTCNVLREQALQNLRHELHTPLTQIMGFLDLLQLTEDHDDADAQARFLAGAQSACEELLSLTETALATALDPIASHPAHLCWVALRHEVQDVLAHFEPRFLQERQIELEIAETLQVYADTHFVRQVMRNLLTNACKYTPTQTRLRVSAAPMRARERVDGRARMICVRICDHGPGILPELQPKVFQRFVRLPNAATRNQPGSGLGLAICKQLVEAMSGSIWVESTGRAGEGCCFAFTLPGDNGPLEIRDHDQCEGECYDKAETPSEELCGGEVPCAPRWGC